MVNLPDVTVARSALAHEAAALLVAESLLAHPDKVSAAAITTAAKIPKRFFTIAPKKWMDIKQRLFRG